MIHKDSARLAQKGILLGLPCWLLSICKKSSPRSCGGGGPFVSQARLVSIGITLDCFLSTVVGIIWRLEAPKGEEAQSWPDESQPGLTTYLPGPRRSVAHAGGSQLPGAHRSTAGGDATAAEAAQTAAVSTHDGEATRQAWGRRRWLTGAPRRR
jgi:hypothetical protein